MELFNIIVIKSKKCFILVIETNDTSTKFLISIYYFMVIFPICYLGFIIIYLTWSKLIANVIHKKKKKILLKDNKMSSKMCFHHNFRSEKTNLV